MTREKIVCEICGNTVSNMAVHEKTRKHIRFAEHGKPTEQERTELKRQYINDYRRAHRMNAEQYREYQKLLANASA